MSTARKMRRKLNRALPGADAETITKALAAVQKAADEQREDRICRRLLKDLKEPADIYAEAYKDGGTDALASFIGFLRNGGLGAVFGAKRLERFVQDFIQYQNDIYHGDVTAKAIDDAIADETGWRMSEALRRAYKAVDAAEASAPAARC